MVCECGKVLTMKQVCRTLLIFSGVVQAWPYRRLVFPEVEVFAWPSDRILSFAESRDVLSHGSYGDVPKPDVKMSSGFKQVVDSATKTPKPIWPKHSSTKATKGTPPAVNKSTRKPEGTSDVESFINITSKHKSEDIRFPKDDAEMISSEFRAKPCSDDVLCDDLYGPPSSEEYPGEAVVRSVQANFEAVKEFFRNELDVSLQESSDVAFRKLPTPSPDETPLCTAESITRFPRRAKTADSNWLLVVNHENYTQGVKIEKCQNENSACYLGENLAPLGYTSVCRQKFALRKLLAITPDGRTIAETFTIPSCCSCYVKRDALALRTKFSPRREPVAELNSTESNSRTTPQV